MKKMFSILALTLFANAVSANDAACIESAKSHFNQLLPAAERVAGRPLTVAIDESVSMYFGSGRDFDMSDTYAVIQHPDQGGKIRIFEKYCRLGADDQIKIMAHELGHAIDFSETLADQYIAARRARTEFLADQWAKRILGAAGFDSDITVSRRLSARGANAAIVLPDGRIRLVRQGG